MVCAWLLEGLKGSLSGVGMSQGRGFFLHVGFSYLGRSFMIIASFR